MADLTLTLGGVAFADFEVPERISGLGGDQMLAVHKLVGGDRVVQALGRDDAPIQWQGRFRGSDAVDRARAIDALRISGQQQSLTFGDFAYSVVIERFTFEFERFYEVPYSISLLVISDQAAAGPEQGPDVDAMLASDGAWASDLGAGIGDDMLSGLLATLSGAMGTVQSFAGAARSVLRTILDPIDACQARVSTLIGSGEAVMGSVDSFGGIVAGSSPRALAQSLLAQSAAAQQSADLYDLSNVLGRMAINIAAIGGSGSYLTVAGSDLYREAVKAYGDASEWATIAAANGLTDPLLAGVQTLLIPPLPGKTQGVLADIGQAPAGAAQSYPLGETVAPSGKGGAGNPGTLDFSDPANSDLLGVV